MNYNESSTPKRQMQRLAVCQVHRACHDAHGLAMHARYSARKKVAWTDRKPMTALAEPRRWKLFGFHDFAAHVMGQRANGVHCPNDSFARHAELISPVT